MAKIFGGRFSADLERVAVDGDVGVWHETYQVGPGRFESVYANMPLFGLAAAGSHVPVGRRGDSAAERLGQRGRA